MAVFNGFKQAFARERLTITSGAAVTLTATTYLNSAAAVDVRSKATGARVAVETASVRFTEEGTTPNVGGGTEVGTLAATGDVIYLDGHAAIVNFRALAVSTTGYIEVTYYR